MGSRLVALGGETGLASLLFAPRLWDGPGRMLGAPLLYEGEAGLNRHDHRAPAEMIIRLLEEGL